VRPFALAFLPGYIYPAVEDPRSRSSIGRVGEHPVFTADDERLDCPFGALVVDLLMAALELSFT
jgi:hypothetical protein